MDRVATERGRRRRSKRIRPWPFVYKFLDPAGGHAADRLRRVTGYFLGVSEGTYLVLSILGVLGGIGAGFDHLGAAEGAKRGVLAGVLFGSSILIAHEIHGAEAEAHLPEPAILLVVITAVARRRVRRAGRLAARAMHDSRRAAGLTRLASEPCSGSASSRSRRWRCSSAITSRCSSATSATAGAAGREVEGPAAPEPAANEREEMLRLAQKLEPGAFAHGVWGAARGRLRGKPGG